MKSRAEGSHSTHSLIQAGKVPQPQLAVAEHGGDAGGNGRHPGLRSDGRRRRRSAGVPHVGLPGPVHAVPVVGRRVGQRRRNEGRRWGRGREPEPFHVGHVQLQQADESVSY